MKFPFERMKRDNEMDDTPEMQIEMNKLARIGNGCYAYANARTEWASFAVTVTKNTQPKVPLQS